MDPQVKSAVIQATGPALVAAIAAVGSFMAGRQSGKASFIQAVHAAAQQVIESLRAEIARVTAKCDAAEAAHRACEARVDALWLQVQAQGFPPVRPDRPRAGAPASDREGKGGL